MKQLDYMERRRGSLVEQLTPANEAFIVNTQKLIANKQKLIKVRTPRRGRSKSIVILDAQEKPRNFPIGRLNNYDKQMKRHKGPLSLASELESIDEVELSDKLESSSLYIYRQEEDENSLAGNVKIHMND